MARTKTMDDHSREQEEALAIALDLTERALRMLRFAAKGDTFRGRLAYNLSRRGLLEKQVDGLDELRDLLSFDGPRKRPARYAITEKGRRVVEAAEKAVK